MTRVSTEPASSSNNNSWLPADVATAYPNVATKFKDVGALAKSYGELEKLQGSSVRIPAADATPEQWGEFYTKVGRPEAPDKYDIKFPEGTPIDDNLLTSFRGTAHQLGLTQTQAAKLAEWWAGQSAGLQEGNAAAQAANQAKWEQELKSEWGYTYDRNVTIAGRGFAAAVDGDPNHPLAKLLDETGLGNHPVMIRYFHDLAIKMGEDKFIDQAQHGPSTEDVEGAKRELKTIYSDMTHGYWKGDETARARVRQLEELIAAGSQ